MIATTTPRIARFSDIVPELVDQGWQSGYPLGLTGAELDELYSGPSRIPCPRCGALTAERLWLHRERRTLFGTREEGKVLAVCGAQSCGAVTELG